MKKGAPQKGKTGPVQPAKTSKAFNPDDYATLTIPRQEVIDVKTAFDVFDADLSGILDPRELAQSFVDLGFTSGNNKFVYQILAELDDDQSGGIDFPEFLRLATAKIGEKDSRAEINKVFKSFDPNNAVIFYFILGKIHNPLTEKSRQRFGRRSK